MCDLDNSYTNLFPTTAPFYLRNKNEGPWIDHHDYLSNNV